MATQVLKYIIIYILFIIGISLVSEWLCCNLSSKYNTKTHLDNYLDNYLDTYLNKVKEELKKEYFLKVKEYMERTSIPNPIQDQREEFINFNSSNNLSQEDIIMRTVNDKLNKGQGQSITLDQHANGRKTLSQNYPGDTDFQLTHANLYKKFKTVDREINWHEPANLVLPEKTNYIVDYKYQFEPSKIPAEPFRIPGSSNINPTEQYTFLDKKYNPENYSVKPLDNYSTSYSMFNKE